MFSSMSVSLSIFFSSCLFSLRSYSSFLRLECSSFRENFSFLHCFSNSYSYWPRWSYFCLRRANCSASLTWSRQQVLTCIDPEVLFCPNSKETSISLIICLVTASSFSRSLQVPSASTSGLLTSSWEKEVILLSDPSRQCRVWTELRLMNRLDRSGWVGSEMLLCLFLVVIIVYFI